MKKILIIGAGFLQAFIIRKAKELGYHTIAIDKNPEAIGFKDADEYAAIDIIDQAKCLKIAEEKKIDGVMTAATDYGVLSAAYLAQKLNLPGLDYEVARTIKNKYNVRRTLFENSVDDVSHYHEIRNVVDIKNKIDSICFPVMVKPCDGSGSKAVERVDSWQELSTACNRAIKASLIGKALVEDFIEGTEYGVESLVFDGETHVLGIMEKNMTNPPDYAELGHSLPSDLLIEGKIREVVKKAINILGINFGGVNMDILVTNDNKICIIDIGARMGGNLIGSHLIPLGTGIDYMGNLIRASLNIQIDLTPKFSKMPVASRILALKPGKIISLPDFEQISEQCHVDIYHHLQIGQIIREYHDNLDGCGYLVATCTEKQDCLKNVELAKILIDNSIIRE